MASVDKKIIDCFWYLQNQCVKGESCEYRHWAPALENPLVCPQWTDGKCQNKECNFRHPSANMAKKATVCYYFTHGGCMKGSNCPFSHDVDVDAVAAATPDLEAAKKKQEEELRRLKEERRKEEERIARLKAEELALQKKKNQEAKQARQGNQKVQQRNSKEVQEVYRPKGSKPTQPQKKTEQQSSGFVKSFEEIQREKLQKQLQEEKKKKPTETVQRKEEPQKKIPKQRGTKAKEQPAESNDTPSFGVKSFADILKEKQNSATNGASTTSPETKKATPTPNQPAPSKVSSPPAKRASNLKSLDDLRKKNQEKFKSSPSPAKRPAESPVGSPQQKKQKSDPTPAPSTTPKTEEKEVDLDFEIGSTGDDEVNIDDEFDKEFNELESLMEA